MVPAILAMRSPCCCAASRSFSRSERPAHDCVDRLPRITGKCEASLPASTCACPFADGLERGWTDANPCNGPVVTPSAKIASALRPKAAAFIVTVYGDVVVPRGGVLWTGTLIELCSMVGINESLVRTAVSRLVATSQLDGERVGRRSYYRLRRSAAADFQRAADLLYGPDRPARGWQIIHDPEITAEDAVRQRMGHMGGSVFIRPDRGQGARDGALVFHAEAITAPERMAGFWDLSALRAGYARFVDLFGAIDPAGMSDSQALMVRLLMVHAYRMVLLRDPRLPQEHLPEAWNGAEARHLFRRLYLALTPGAHRYVALSCEGVGGTLPAETEATRQRQDMLTAPD